MIEHLDWKLKLIILGGPFVIGLIGLAVDIHIARSGEYALMTSALQRSQCLSYAKMLWGEKSISSKILVISIISGPLLSPGPSIRKGLLDAQDYEHFPKYLKIKIRTASAMNTAGCALLTINYFLL